MDSSDKPIDLDSSGVYLMTVEAFEDRNNSNLDSTQRSVDDIPDKEPEASAPEVDYGPLFGLIGIWKGNRGLDVSPEPEGEDQNAYYETITFTAIGDVTNAESQILSVLRYHQEVYRQSNDELLHDEVGYWMWDAQKEIVIQSLVTPRGVSAIAGGSYSGEKDPNGNIVFEVVANLDSTDWKITQAPFMQENARTTEFRNKIAVGNKKIFYSETTLIDIYGKTFEHTDENTLIKIS